jgi:2-keto-4-pentenoate hydratase/2-oxohepta-3-ene-1,7-dioic acid hydratase in catechol pathway
MPILVVRYILDGEPHWAKLSGAPPERAMDKVTIWPIKTSAKTTSGLIAEIDSGQALVTDTAVTIAAADLLSPVTEDAQLICQGLNYGDHSSESGVHVRKRNLIFMKASSSLSGAYDDIVRPGEVQLLDYEIEIGLVLRQDIREAVEITDENIGEYVAGVVLCNDISARDVMFGAIFLQWFEGKSFRTFCPTGPVLYLVEPQDTAETLRSLEMTLSLNGELRQSAVSDKMIFKPTETLTHLSSRINLKRGDVLLTGTPGGVIAQPNLEVKRILETQLMSDQTRQAALCAEFHTLATFLKPGDVITANLRDLRTNLALGGQHTAVVAA